MTVGKLWAKADSRRRMGGGKIVDKEKDKKKKDPILMTIVLANLEKRCRVCAILAAKARPNTF